MDMLPIVFLSDHSSRSNTLTDPPMPHSKEPDMENKTLGIDERECVGVINDCEIERAHEFLVEGRVVGVLDDAGKQVAVFYGEWLALRRGTEAWIWFVTS